MEEQQTDRKLLSKGVKYLMIALPLMFLGPIVIHSSLKNQAHPLFYPILILGCLICLSSMLLFFKGLKTIIKSLFGN